MGNGINLNLVSGYMMEFKYQEKIVKIGIHYNLINHNN